MTVTQFMSLEQAFTLLEKEVAQGKYNLPVIAKLTKRERALKASGLPLDAQISLESLKALSKIRDSKQKYKGRCYQLPVIIIEKKLTMICYLQNLRK
jgi:hypothetical protein